MIPIALPLTEPGLMGEGPGNGLLLFLLFVIRRASKAVRIVFRVVHAILLLLGLNKSMFFFFCWDNFRIIMLLNLV